LGRRDGGATLDELTDHVRALNGCTALPVSVDLESGHGGPAAAIERVASAGAVGGSIEDWDPGTGLYPREAAAERVAAAVQAARRLPFPFTLTARAENHIRGNPDLEDTITRLQAYEQAGADVLYAPGLRDAEQIRAVCAAVSKPVNVLAHRALPRSSTRGPSASAWVARSPGPRSRPWSARLSRSATAATSPRSVPTPGSKTG
jgi:2-methylisocitrate lyase-like PEP mutase family enzyme